MAYWRKDILRFQVRAALLYWLVIPAAVLGGGRLIDLLWRWQPWPRLTALMLGAGLLLLCGVWFIDRASRDFARYGDGTPAPQAPPKRLVHEGVYAWCRHPMWFGYDLAALGVIILCRSWGMLLVSYPVFILLQLRFLRHREERLLVRRFKDDYLAYCKRVPRLIPRPPKQG